MNRMALTPVFSNPCQAVETTLVNVIETLSGGVSFASVSLELYRQKIFPNGWKFQIPLTTFGPAFLEKSISNCLRHSWHYYQANCEQVIYAPKMNF